MALDVDVPTPPDLTNRGVPAELADSEAVTGEGDLRREELEAALDESAWTEGFNEWAHYTDLTETDVRVADEAGLFRELDFFYDPDAERLRYVVPAVPGDWDTRVGDDGSSAGTVANELDDLGRTVAETVALDYVDWTDPDDVNAGSSDANSEGE